MLSPLNGLSQDDLYDVRNSLGHGLLLGDLSFFVVAVFDAQIYYEDILGSNCSLTIDYFNVSLWATIGYAIRLLFTLLLFILKVINLYKFVSRTQIFPKVGAVFSPFMSALLLTTIVYDYTKCKSVSSVFTIQTANIILTSCALVSSFLIFILIVILLVEYATGQPRNKCLFSVVTLILGICIVFGTVIGLIASFDVYSSNHIPLFMLYDTFSFVLGIGYGCRPCFKKLYLKLQQNHP